MGNRCDHGHPAAATTVMMKLEAQLYQRWTCTFPPSPLVRRSPHWCGLDWGAEGRVPLHFIAKRPL